MGVVAAMVRRAEAAAEGDREPAWSDLMSQVTTNRHQLRALPTSVPRKTRHEHEDDGDDNALAAALARIAKVRQIDQPVDRSISAPPTLPDR